jgi:putative heme-binding domain-containing protein
VFEGYLRIVLLGCAMVPAIERSALGQEGATPPHWIWYPWAQALHEIPAETCYFRKMFAVKEPSRLVLDVTADDAFTLYLDGKEVATGNDWLKPQKVEVRLAVGPHVLAARATNNAPGPAGLLLRGGVLPLGQGVPIHTNSSWKATPAVPPGNTWTGIEFDDSRWARAADLGALGKGPWGNIATSEDSTERFRVPEGFQVSMAASPELTGSVVAFTFDPGGSPCVSTERGPIARLIDDDEDGRYDRREVIEDRVRNCQGLSFIRGWLYTVGNGPKGAGIYRLRDANRDGIYEQVELVHGAFGGMGEHGPHAVALGPDGCLYYNNGNHAHLVSPIDPGSPVNVSYEGELLPHYNDSSGHAAGIMAPGGEILRSDDDGKTWKRIVAGFRNQYDFAFNADSELFTFDSDMEYDVGLPWYRPVRVNHCLIGAEFGWRNGSAKWPSYYADSLPSILDVGRGSPTGVTFYQASQFPPPYRGSFLICDWSQGRILAVQLKRQGATYSAAGSELVSGQPLNCTDIETGPDGSVYFTTGGRGTQGGLFRVSWSRAKHRPTDGDREARGIGPAVAERPQRFRDQWEAITIDSPLASYSQRRIDEIRRSDPEKWNRFLEEMLRPPGTTAESAAGVRVRALDLLCQFGPQPSDDMLIALAADNDALVRARAVTLLGQRRTQPVRDALEKALQDTDPFVRRHACESLMQQPRETIPIARLLALLGDPDRFIRFSARVAIEHGRVDDLMRLTGALAKSQPRLLIQALLATVRASRLDERRQAELLQTEMAILRTELDADLRVDLLRVIELTYMLGPRKHDATDSDRLRPILLGLFSTTVDTPANRETARLLAFLGEPRAVGAILQHQATVTDLEAQIHDAYCLRALKQGWSGESKKRLWSWYQDASEREAGYSFRGYLDRMIQELIGLLDQPERERYLAAGERYPFPTQVLVRSIRLDRGSRWVPELTSLYGRLGSKERAGSVAELRARIVERLGTSARPEAPAALRALYRLDPQHGDPIVRALAAHPNDEDLEILVVALDSRDRNTSNLALRALGRLNANPTGPQGLANLIRLARREGPAMTGMLNRLASRWTGVATPKEAKNFDQVLAAWEVVYHQRFPAGPSLAESGGVEPSKYSLAVLVERVLSAGVMRTASSWRGQQVIERAKCLDCHKFGPKGEGLGPDLSTVSSRFRPVEILESIVEPSKVISDRYKPVSVATSDGKVYNGMPVVNDGPNLVLLLSDGTKVTIPKNEIDGRRESSVSVMPAGLINSLSFQEIADMLALFDSAPRVEAPAAGKK